MLRRELLDKLMAGEKIFEGSETGWQKFLKSEKYFELVDEIEKKNDKISKNLKKIFETAKKKI